VGGCRGRQSGKQRAVAAAVAAADIVSGCESFITERELSRAERGELGIFDVVAGRYEYRKVSKGIQRSLRMERAQGLRRVGRNGGRDGGMMLLHAAAIGTRAATLRNC